MNKLKGMSVYLCGPIDHADDCGAGWRNEITPYLENYGVHVYNPLNKPFGYTQFNEDQNFRQIKRNMRSKNDWAELSRCMKEVRQLDLRMVDLSSFIIVYLDLDLTMCGTWEEIFAANESKRPIIVMCPQGKENIPDWLFGTLPHELFFSDWEGVFGYLHNINNGADNRTFKRWVFFQEQQPCHAQ